VTNPLLDFTYDDLLRGQKLFDLAERALRETSASGTAIALKQGDAYVCCAVAGDTAPSLGVALQNDEGITGACIHSGRPEICSDAAMDERVNAAACELLGVASVIAVPVLDDGEVIAVIEALSRHPNAFGAAEQSAVEALARQFRPATSADWNRAQLDPPLTIDSFSSASQTAFPPVSYDSRTVNDLAPKSVPPQSNTDFAREEIPSLSGAGQQRGGWTRGAFIALVCVGIAVTVAISLSRRPTLSAPAQPQKLTSAASSLAAAGSGSTAVSTAPAASSHHSARPNPVTSSTMAELQAAASAGNRASELKLAAALARGDGVQKNLVSAYAWYTAANISGAEDPSGFLPALAKSLSAAQIAEVRLKLAEMFWRGVGVKQDSTAAYLWLLLAQAAGSPVAETYQHRLAAGMTKSQVREAEQKADRWLSQHHQPTLRRQK